MSLVLLFLSYLGLHGNLVLFFLANTDCSQSLCCTATFYFAAGAMDIAHNTTITLKYRGRFSYPTWYMNGYPVPPGPLYQVEYDPSTGDLLGILIIDGNETCGVLNVSCRVEGQIVYTERLTIEGL